MNEDDRPLTPSQLVNKMHGHYDGAELKPAPGITRDRLEAYQLPSIQGGWRIWPNGMKERIK